MNEIDVRLKETPELLAGGWGTDPRQMVALQVSCFDLPIPHHCEKHLCNVCDSPSSWYLVTEARVAQDAIDLCIEKPGCLLRMKPGMKIQMLLPCWIHQSFAPHFFPCTLIPRSTAIGGTH